MALADESYDEPLKRRGRSVVLTHAVESLTGDRHSSPLATAVDFDRLLDYCLEYFRKYFRQDLADSFLPLRDYWQELHASRVGRRNPGDLKVLVLAGPKPLNDFEELAGLGVSPHNVWAVEGDRDAFRSAANQLRAAGFPTKLHFGSLHEFFAVVPEQFDIVYFDACGPLFGGKSKTNLVLQELFLHQRMAPLSALITNFAATPRDNEDTWVKRLFAWYAARFFQPVYHDGDEIERVNGESDFEEHVRKNLEEYYSDFVSRFTIEFAGQLLPWWRVRALPGASREYFAPEGRLKSAIQSAIHVPDHADTAEEILRSVGHAQLSPSSYPHFWTAKGLRTNNLNN